MVGHEGSICFHIGLNDQVDLVVGILINAQVVARKRS